MDINKAKQVSIESYLRSQGYLPTNASRSTGKYLVYASMLHNENNPSFYVDKTRNKWKDFGYNSQDSKWEDVISLVMLIEGVDFRAALKKLLKGNLETKEIISKERVPGITVESISPLKDQRLINYLIIRGVNIDIAKIYCNQAEIKLPFSNDPDKIHLYISFENKKEGLELRNYYDKSGKLSTSPKYYSEIKGKENHFNFFEGFIDYLTMLTELKTERLRNTTIILNSLVNFAYLYDRMKVSDENNLFVDNDESADKYIYKGDPLLHIVSLKDQNIIFNDKRKLLFPQANDINDFKMGKIII